MKNVTHAFVGSLQKATGVCEASYIIYFNLITYFRLAFWRPPLSMFNIPNGLMMGPYQSYILGADRRDVEETLSPCLCDHWGG